MSAAALPDSAGWQPVALGIDIESGTVAGTRLFGRDLAVWRDSQGGVHVWEDRCPHRGMRLSFGFVRGDRLACLYHGWQFDPAGRCRFIPAHPTLTVPATIAATRYAAVERGGVVWVSGEGDAPTEPPPSPMTDPLPVRSLTVATALDRVAGALPAPAWTGAVAISQVGPDRVAVALQPLAAQETCLHLVVLAPSGEPPAAQARVSSWAEALRTAVEEAT